MRGLAFFLVKCGQCSAKGRSRTFGELHRMADEKGGGWGFRPYVRQTVSAWPGRPHGRLVGEFQTGRVELDCPSCRNKLTPRVWRLGKAAEEAERRGVSTIWV